LTGSEDFAFMLQKVPGSYLLIGNGDGAGSCMVHNPAYDFNDDNIAIGSAYWVLLTRRYLAATADGADATAHPSRSATELAS
jgi:hippurate hydrolase